MTAFERIRRVGAGIALALITVGLVAVQTDWLGRHGPPPGLASSAAR
jgi:hypothetical protein